MTIRLEGYEGPLDLLLHLIKRDEIDIWNIPIARVTEQYLKYLQLMRDLNISVAGEWLVMAATLIHIKSHMLLPPDPSAPGIEEAAEDPRTELVYQLLEHLKYKNAAQMLYTRQEVENAVWNRPPSEVIEEGKDLLAVSLFDLLRAFNEVVERFSQRSRIELFGEEVTVAQKIEEIRRLLLIQDALQFSAFFQDAPSKQHLIATFLALLELVRLKEIGVRQRKTFGEIWISRSLSPA
jgi:segregation and condensation protein A